MGRPARSTAQLYDLGHLDRLPCLASPVPEATAHGKLIEQFAAPRPANAAHLASNTTNPQVSATKPVNAITVNAITVNAITVNAIKTFHADPIQNEVTQNEVTQNEVVSDAKRKK